MKIIGHVLLVASLVMFAVAVMLTGYPLPFRLAVLGFLTLFVSDAVLGRKP